MDQFQKNILSKHKNYGKIWLSRLPEKIHELAKIWNLKNLKELNNLSCNYLLSCTQDDVPVVLKISIDTKSIQQEANALKIFSRNNYVKILDQQEGAILLEQALPGNSLKSYIPENDLQANQIASQLILNFHETSTKQISLQPDFQKDFPHIKDWLEILDKNWNMPSPILKAARDFRNDLLLSAKQLQTSYPSVLLHGDFHHDNILKHKNHWIIIDPKGVIGESAFEIPAFISNPISTLLHYTDTKVKLTSRISQFSHALNIDARRIVNWCFVRSVLHWAWALEDNNTDAEHFKKLTNLYLEL